VVQLGYLKIIMSQSKVDREAKGIDLFNLENAQDLFSEIQVAICEYHIKPNSRLFLFLIFALNHLPEWIAESSSKEIRKSIKRKKEARGKLSRGEEFFLRICELQEYKIVKNLCNRSKHHLIEKIEKTSITEGMNVNGFCSDSLDQKSYLIDGIDSRIIFAAVIHEYCIWFQENSQSIG